MKSRKVQIVSLCILAALAIWIHARYDTWFKNLPEPSYKALEAPGRILLTFGTEDALSRNVSWQCGTELLPSQLELVDVAAGDTVILPAEGETFVSRSGEMAYYHALLRQLKADATYRYRVATGPQQSDWQTFHTYNSSTKEDFSFLYFGDVQDSIGGCFGQYLQAAMERHPETEFLLFGGDLTERPMDCYWEETFRELGPYAATCPVLNITGNHDYLKSLPVHLERRFPLIFSYFLDSQVGVNQVYTVRYNDLQLFLLDSNRELPYLWQQRQWLDQALSASDAPWKVVVLHHPLHSLKGPRNNLIQRWMFDPIIRRHNVQLVLQGHEHTFARQLPPTDSSGPAYLVSHCSPKRYDIHPDGRYDVYGLESRYYQQVRINREGLTVQTFDATSGQLVDGFRLHNSGQPVDSFRLHNSGQPVDSFQLQSSGPARPVAKPIHYNAFSHNDYERPRPLFDALDLRFNCVEADLWLIEGELYVSHDTVTPHPDITFEKMYLQPLVERIRQNGGKVYPESDRPFYLMVDCKTDGEAMYPVLKKKLEPYESLFCHEQEGQLQAGAILFYLSGRSPRKAVAAETNRFIFLDGRIDDLGKGIPAAQMPVISDNYGKYLQWKGQGEIPAEELEKMRGYIRQAHAEGKLFRWGGAPDRPPFKEFFLQEGVDLIGADDLQGLVGIFRK